MSRIPQTGYFLTTDEIENVYNQVLSSYDGHITSAFTKPCRRIITYPMDFWFFDVKNTNPETVMHGVSLDIAQISKEGFFRLNKNWRTEILASMHGNPNARIIIDVGD